MGSVAIEIGGFEEERTRAFLVVIFLYFDVSFMIWVLLGALGVYVTADFDLSPSQVGLIVAIPTLAGSFFRIALGILTDRFGPKRRLLAECW